MFKNKKIHLIGIGGVSMSGLAYMLKDMGAIVTGSDSNESKLTKKLVNNGFEIVIGSNKNFVNNADIIVYTAAIKETDTELSFAIKNNKERYERAEFLGMLSKLYKNCLCIAGTHGKSTTTGLVSSIFLEAKLNPTISIGANLPSIDGNIYIGSKDYLIMESCEYVDSFLHFHPTSSIITNVDNDHLDYFHNLDNIKKSFEKYSSLVPENGYLIINNDDENSKELLNNKTNIITYAINNNADFTAKNISFNEFGYPVFDVYYNDKYLTTLNLNITGEHNIYNSLAAFALSNNYINDFETIKKGIESYKGVGRRFEFIGNYNDALIYDDYAHHPTEVATTLNSAKNIKSNKNYVVFQGHTYSRTKEHLSEFASILAKFDNIIIAPIYGAREINTYNVKEEDLVNLIKEENDHVIYLETFEKIESHLKNILQPNDLVITVGAGPINQVAENIKEKTNII